MWLCGSFEPLESGTENIFKEGRYALNNCGGPMHWYILQENLIDARIVWVINYLPQYKMCYIFSSHEQDANNMQEYALKYPHLQSLIQNYNFISLGHDGLFVLLSDSIKEIEEICAKFEPDELGGQLDYFKLWE